MAKEFSRIKKAGLVLVIAAVMGAQNVLLAASEEADAGKAAVAGLGDADTGKDADKGKAADTGKDADKGKDADIKGKAADTANTGKKEPFGKRIKDWGASAWNKSGGAFWGWFTASNYEERMDKDGNPELDKDKNKIMDYKGRWFNKYPQARTAVLSAVAMYGAMKFYAYLKKKAALNKASQDTKLEKYYNELQSLNVKLDDPNLSDEERASLDSRRRVVVSSIVTEYYQDKGAMDEILEVMKAMVPVAA